MTDLQWKKLERNLALVLTLIALAVWLLCMTTEVSFWKTAFALAITIALALATINKTFLLYYISQGMVPCVDCGRYFSKEEVVSLPEGEFLCHECRERRIHLTTG